MVLPLRTSSKWITQQQLMRHHWIGLDQKVLYAHDWQGTYLTLQKCSRTTLSKMSWRCQSLIYLFISLLIIKNRLLFHRQQIVERTNRSIWVTGVYWMLVIHGLLESHTLATQLVVQYNNRCVSGIPCLIKWIYKSESFQ